MCVQGGGQLVDLTKGGDRRGGGHRSRHGVVQLEDILSVHLRVAALAQVPLHSPTCVCVCVCVYALAQVQDARESS